MQRKFNAQIKGKRNTFCQALGGKSSRKMTTKEYEKGTRGMFKAVLTSWIYNMCMCLKGSHTVFKALLLLSENIYYILNNNNNNVEFFNVFFKGKLNYVYYKLLFWYTQALVPK